MLVEPRRVLERTVWNQDRAKVEIEAEMSRTLAVVIMAIRYSPRVVLNFRLTFSLASLSGGRSALRA